VRVLVTVPRGVFVRVGERVPGVAVGGWVRCPA
jgi:hypothetical protein